MAGPPPSFPCICFLGDTSDGDTLLSPFGPQAEYWSQPVGTVGRGFARPAVGGWELSLASHDVLLLSRP